MSETHKEYGGNGMPIKEDDLVITISTELGKVKLLSSQVLRSEDWLIENESKIQETVKQMESSIKEARIKFLLSTVKGI